MDQENGAYAQASITVEKRPDDNSISADNGLIAAIRRIETADSGLSRLDFMPKLTKPGYFTSPPMEDLKFLSQEKLSHIENFSIFNTFGKVEFLEPVDITFEDLDAAININHKSIEVYPDERGQKYHTSKPAVGTKLNKPAKLYYYRMDLPCFNKLNEMAKNVEAQITDYLPHSRTMAVEVAHFTKYEFKEGDSDEEESSQPYQDDGKSSGFDFFKKDRFSIPRREQGEQQPTRSLTLPMLPGIKMDLERGTIDGHDFSNMIFQDNRTLGDSTPLLVRVFNDGTQSKPFKTSDQSFHKIDIATRFRRDIQGSNQQGNLHPLDEDFERFDSLLSELNFDVPMEQLITPQDSITGKEQQLVDLAESCLIE